MIELGYADPKQHRRQRPQLRRRRRRVHRHALEDVRGGRHGRRRDRPLHRLQPELGLVVPGARAAAARTATTTTSTARAAGASRRGTSPRCITSSRRSRTCPKSTAPFLIMHGTADPTVSFSEGHELLQRASLQQEERDHARVSGRRARAARPREPPDLTIRYFQFFDHYLKGAPAPKWMTDGVPYIVKDVIRGDPK